MLAPELPKNWAIPICGVCPLRRPARPGGDWSLRLHQMNVVSVSCLTWITNHSASPAVKGREDAFPTADT